MSLPKDLEFGQRVQVNNRLYRREKRESTSTLKVWEEHPFIEFEPTEGIFLGYRTLNNGYRNWYSDHIEYRPKEYFTVALVAVDANKNPFYTTDIT